MSYKFPSDINYTMTHEWVELQNSIATVGITDYAQHQLGDIVFVELPEIGMVLEKESHAGEIESVKAVGDIIMPLSGEIVEVNEKLAENPELVNSSPFGDGWMIKINISHASEIDELISVEKYKEFVKSEEQ
ncbi:MAG: glycine cleavage system protein GcvH [Candidatus Lokiarchaeota archaeon]|nr:glycine cleavage system protein GcvH [Candidatus Lokiarchaeota archaeon]